MRVTNWRRTASHSPLQGAILRDAELVGLASNTSNPFFAADNPLPATDRINTSYIDVSLLIIDDERYTYDRSQ
jgi:hypothetical protein